MVVIGDYDTTVRAIYITLFPELLLVVTAEKRSGFLSAMRYEKEQRPFNANRFFPWPVVYIKNHL